MQLNSLKHFLVLALCLSTKSFFKLVLVLQDLISGFNQTRIDLLILLSLIVTSHSRNKLPSSPPLALPFFVVFVVVKLLLELLHALHELTHVIQVQTRAPEPSACVTHRGDSCDRQLRAPG